MLEERDYMRNDRKERNIGSSGMKCLFILILINVFVFIIGTPELMSQMILTSNVLDDFQLWRFVTAAFVHADFWHLFFNMFGLFMFGSMSAPILGWRSFLWLYLTSALVGNLLWFVFNINSGGGLLGASGAVIGVIMATAMMMPNVQVLLLFFPVPIKLKTLAVVYILLEVIQQQTMVTGIAYLAHIGGFIGGFAFMELFAARYVSWHPFGLFKRFAKKKPYGTEDEPVQYRKSSPPRGWTVSSYDAYTGGSVSKNEVDRVLDKLSKTGVNSLSEAEMDILRKAREQMKSGQSSR